MKRCTICRSSSLEARKVPRVVVAIGDQFVERAPRRADGDAAMLLGDIGERRQQVRRAAAQRLRIDSRSQEKVSSSAR